MQLARRIKHEQRYKFWQCRAYQPTYTDLVRITTVAACLPAFCLAATSCWCSVNASTLRLLTADGILTYSVCDSSNGDLTCLDLFLLEAASAGTRHNKDATLGMQGWRGGRIRGTRIRGGHSHRATAAPVMCN